ncbi:MAG: branched-chain amino acid ABC transporter permease, partial [Gemmobacter sp.]
MSTREIRNLILSALAFGLLALLPFYVTGYLLSIGTTMAMFTVLATSWELFSGPTHYISLATAAFFGLGTFVTGYGFQTLSYWSLPVIAAVLGAGLAGLVGRVTL